VHGANKSWAFYTFSGVLYVFGLRAAREKETAPLESESVRVKQFEVYCEEKLKNLDSFILAVAHKTSQGRY